MAQNWSAKEDQKNYVANRRKKFTSLRVLYTNISWSYNPIIYHEVYGF